MKKKGKYKILSGCLLGVGIVTGILWVLWIISYCFSFRRFHNVEGDIQNFERINLQFRIDYLDSTRIIHFGNKNLSRLSNYFEIRKHLDVVPNLFWIVIDNTYGDMEIKCLIFEPLHYYSFRIPEYEYVVSQITNEPDSLHLPSWNFCKDLPLIATSNEEVGKSEVCNFKIPNNYILAKISITPYDRNIVYNLYDMGHINNLGVRLRSMISSTRIMLFTELQKNICIDYDSINNRYPNKKRYERTVIVTPKNKRRYISENSWLFLDTMDIHEDTRIRQVVWINDTSKLMLFYRTYNGSFIPINGAYYKNYLKSSELYFK